MSLVARVCLAVMTKHGDNDNRPEDGHEPTSTPPSPARSYPEAGIPENEERFLSVRWPSVGPAATTFHALVREVRLHGVSRLLERGVISAEDAEGARTTSISWLAWIAARHLLRVLQAPAPSPSEE